MKFDKYQPHERLKPYVRYFIVSENPAENSYKVFPSTGLVLGFQYKGRLTSLKGNVRLPLATAGITGISDILKIFHNDAATGSVLVFFTEVGFSFFSSAPVNELFNQSISLDNLFDKNKITETEERLGLAKTDKQRIFVVEQFLTALLKDIQSDRLIIEAVKMIYAANGNVRIKELIDKLCISQSPFEKRFRKLVGTTPKKFASIVRFNAVLNTIEKNKSLTEMCYENNFFDQAHFIKDFKKYTGYTPENFKRFL